MRHPRCWCHHWIITLHRSLHSLSNRSSSRFLIPSCCISCTWSLSKSALSRSWGLSHHSHWSRLWPPTWGRSFTSYRSFGSTKSRWSCHTTSSLNLTTWCKIPSISSRCSSIQHWWSPFWSIPFWWNSSAFFHRLLNISNFMLVPFRWLLIFVTLDRHICSAGSIINFLSLNLRLLILRLVPLFFLLNFINLMQDICPFIFNTLLSHDVIVSSLDTDSSGAFCLRRTTGDCKWILSIRRECPSSVESALVVLVFSLNDLFVAKVFHGILVRPTEFHFFN